MQLRHYVSASGRDPLQRWLDRLGDMRCRLAVLRRIDRLAMGNPGDERFCRDGVWELQIDCGLGYRVYFSRLARDQILLLGGGSKSTQRADIAQAVEHLRDYRTRS